MKRILSIMFASLLVASTAHSGGMIGIKYGSGDLEGTKQSYTAGSTTYAADTREKSNQFGAIFAEIEMPQLEDLSIGAEYIPYKATISIDGNSSDSHLELSDHTTIYGLFMPAAANGAYFKAGYAMADIGGVAANYTSTTVNSFDNSLEGPMLGAGFQKELISSIMGRVEITYTDYDDVSVTTTSNGSASVKKTGNAELTTFTVSLSKQF